MASELSDAMETCLNLNQLQRAAELEKRRRLVKVTEHIAKLVGEHRRIQSAILLAAENGQEPAVGNDNRSAEILAELAELGERKKGLIDHLNAFENFYAKRIHDVHLIDKHLRRVS
ncbi:hypothetical protein QQ045_001536 [Rhodiola kirilowii]